MSGCACGHHHPHHHHGHAASGAKVALTRPMIAVTGRLICQDAGQMMTALSLLPDHVQASRAEPGCLRFDLWQDDDPLIWNLSELFADADALAAHQARLADSAWGQGSTGMARDYHRHEMWPVIRRETRKDTDAVAALLTEAFGGTDEASLVHSLRRDGDLSLSLVADAGGAVIGHAALSPLQADRAAYALAPVAVSPKAQRRGIGAALVQQAMEWADEAAVVVLGDPEYYGPLGFLPTDLASPYAGPHLQMIGNLPKGSPIQHAPAFAVL